jgi:uncharacterized protein YyaL (SSP411 family)
MSERPDDDRPANRLADETSPYLLQHAHNPVDWFPWGDEAFERARAEDRPIFLSVGYSACHWCHVMERESFENGDIAALMNENFVNVKVDREERPDVDQIYMAAVQAMTGHGGWPMSVFLTPDGKPFYGGTYFPPADRHGMPGFPRVLLSVAQAWREQRERIVGAAGQLTEQLQGLGSVGSGGGGSLDASALDNAYLKLSRAFEPTYGGFGDAPKFPHPMDVRVLLRHHHRTADPHALHMVRHTLDHMARGGLYDHLGGGFARYSTDDRWLVPHFEKMLYDNALLATAYLEAYQATGEPEYRRVVRETLDYVLGRMTGPEGGFYSTEDADSEGVEGKYYVWSLDEVQSLLGDRAETFAAVYDVTAHGNWEHANILNLPRPIPQAAARLGVDEDDLRRELAESRRILLEARDRRVPPGKDTKVLTSWNGLAIAAFAEAARVVGGRPYLDAAERAAGFLLDALRTPDGRLLHSYKDGRARFNGYLDDYSYLLDGLVRLFEATGAPRWISSALDLAQAMLDEFRDPADGGFFYTGGAHEALIARNKDATDNATPSGNAMAATALLRLAALTGRTDLEDAGRGALGSAAALIQKAPTAAGQSLIALDFLLAPVREFAVIGGDEASEYQEVLGSLARRFLPHKVVAPSRQAADPELAAIVPLLADRPAVEGRTTTYICENFACRAPVVGVEGLERALAEGGPR